MQALVRYRCANAEATRSALGKDWKLNWSKPALLAEAPELIPQDCRYLAEARHARSRPPHFARYANRRDLAAALKRLRSVC